MSLAVAHSNTDVRAFRVDIAQDDIDDMQAPRRRDALAHTRERHRRVAGRSTRDHAGRRRALGRRYDWRALEARLNSFPQFLMKIDGLDIHFIHVRSKHDNALPIIITHGWPGSVVEQLKIIGPLTDPTAYGGSAADAFDVVIPSLPGYGFSGKPTEPGKWVPTKIAASVGRTHERLGYSRYVAQGGDWGNAVTETMGLQRPPACWRSARTCRRRFRLRSRARWPRDPLPHKISCPTSAARGSSSTSSTRRVWATPTRWRCGRRRCTASRTRRSAWPPG